MKFSYLALFNLMVENGSLPPPGIWPAPAQPSAAQNVFFEITTMSIWTNFIDFGAMNIISETEEAASEYLKWSLLYYTTSVLKQMR